MGEGGKRDSMCGWGDCGTSPQRLPGLILCAPGCCLHASPLPFWALSSCNLLT